MRRPHEVRQGELRGFDGRGIPLGDYSIGDFIYIENLNPVIPPEVWKFEGHTSSVQAVSAHPSDGGCFSGSRDDTVRKLIDRYEITG